MAQTSVRPLESAEFHRALDPALFSALDDAPDVAARAALAIGRTRLPAGAEPLRAHLGARDVPVRAMVVYALGLLIDAPACRRSGTSHGTTQTPRSATRPSMPWAASHRATP